MLTIKQPAHYGYRSVHDLPTPPSSTYRLSPPVVYQEAAHRTNPTPPRTSTPSAIQQMSSSHRPLPPPAAMTLAQHPSQASGGHPPPPGPPPLSQPPLQQSIPQSQHGTHLPPPPQWHQGSGEDSMRAWLAAKAEEEKRKQEEERTRQESLRLEQRKMEHEILRTSLSGGIPPSMVPVVFAGMGGGTLTQAALEMAHHVMQSQMPQAGQPQLLPPAGPASPEHRRDQQGHSYGQYSSTGPMPGTPGSAHATHSGFVSSAAYPGSPTRSRGYSGPSRPLGAGLPNLNTNVPQGPSGPPSQAHPSAASAQPQEAQPSPSIYFHHWQPPTSQGGGSSSHSATPSVSESPRKRKATGPQQPAPPPSNQQRPRSPPFGQPGSSTTLANPPPGRRRGHARQRSDVSSYRLGGARPRSEIWTSSHRAVSPIRFAGPSTAATRGSEEPPSRQQTHQARAGAHSVSSLLSEQPSPHLVPRASSSMDVRPRRSESEPGNSPGRMLEDKAAQGGAGGSTRERDDQ